MTNTLLPADIERVVIGGDLSPLDATQRIEYYQAVCKSVGLNPLTQPFEFIKFQGKTIMYARRNCTDQLRMIHDIEITKIEDQFVSDLYVVTAYAKTKVNRVDADKGAVCINGMKGADLANALMKCVTKAKRRVTLSICGLSLLDETEVEDTAASAPVDITPKVTLIERKKSNIEDQAGPFFYDLTTEKDEAKSKLVSNYLYDNGGEWLEESAEWKSEKLLKKAVAYLVKKENQEAAQQI